ncbi:MAG: hypothetical protein ACPHN2_05915 [Sinimarinibacterium flocculans]|uniref:hypothetical protein n=1 Tax=Sinimarinibacterium flocculans TaxID=985250 RepID=UPI002EB0AB54|nr:hypothetical protein [Pseudomonadota bacterium]
MKAVFSPQEIEPLKREARLRKRERGIPPTAALDKVAREQNFVNWWLLMKQHSVRLAHYESGPDQHKIRSKSRVPAIR